MRYDVKVVFISKTEDKFDPSIGEVVPGETTQVERLCAVSDLTSKRKVELFGRIKDRALSIHYRGSFLSAEKVNIPKGDFAGTYQVMTTRSMRNKHSLVVEEMK